MTKTTKTTKPVINHKTKRGHAYEERVTSRPVKTTKTKRAAAAVVFPAVKTPAARTWRARSEAIVVAETAAAKTARQAAQKAARRTARTAAKTTKPARRTRVARPVSGAAVCAKCGRQNSHGADCRTVSACAARRQAVKGGAR